MAEQRRQFDLTRADNAPFLKTGQLANKRLAYLLGLGNPSGNDSNYRVPDGFTYQPQQSDLNSWEIASDANGGRYYWRPSDDKMVPVSEREAVASGVYGPGNTTQAPLPATATDNSQFGSLLRKFSASDLEADPVYQSGLQFGADQGRDAINARATQAGSYDSGATLKALTRFGNDYGSQKANESYNRFNNDQSNIYSRLTGTSGSGQVASGGNASAGAAATNGIASSLDAAGNARAAGIVGGANAWGTGITGAAGAYNNYQNNNQLMALLKGTNSGAGTSGYGYNGAAPYTNYYATD